MKPSSPRSVLLVVFIVLIVTAEYRLTEKLLPKEQKRLPQQNCMEENGDGWPSVAVIIPIHNWERRNALLQAIRSVVNQTYQGRLETIVVDTSMDPRANELDELRFPRPVHITHVKPPKGTWSGFPRNVGIRAAKNFEYVAFQDSDDVWFPNKLELQFQFMKFYNTSFVTSDFVLPKRCRLRPHIKGAIWKDWSLDEMLESPWGNGGEYRLQEKGNPLLDWAYLPPLANLKLLEWGNFASTSSVVIRRSVLIDHALLFNETQPYAEDWDLWKRILGVSGMKMGYLSRPTFALDHYCHGGASTNYESPPPLESNALSQRV